jgi:hypothetical protein
MTAGTSPLDTGRLLAHVLGDELSGHRHAHQVGRHPSLANYLIVVLIRYGKSSSVSLQLACRYSLLVGRIPSLAELVCRRLIVLSLKSMSFSFGRSSSMSRQSACRGGSSSVSRQFTCRRSL